MNRISIRWLLGTLVLVGLVAPPWATAQEPPKPAATEAAQDVDADVLTITLPDANAKAAPATFVMKRLIDSLEENFGLTLAEASGPLRSQLELPKGEGIVVVDVNAGGLADQAGVKRNDILVEVGKEKAKDVAQVREILLGLGGEAVQVKLIRNGKPRQFSMVGPAHGIPVEPTAYWIGVPVSPVDATLRAHLPALPAGAGLIVNDVVKESPAEQATVHKDDILISIGGSKPLDASQLLVAAVQATEGKPSPLQILRAGKELTLTITPSKRARPNSVNLPISFRQLKYTVVRPNMAFLADPSQPREPSSLTLGPDTSLEVKYLLSGKTIRVDPTGAKQTPAVPALTWTPLLTDAPADREATARIEAQLKDLASKLDEVVKTLEAIKKSTDK